MGFDWLPAQGLEHLPHYLTALATGLLIGLERERNPTAKAGLRTCALVALAGAASATLAQVLDAAAIVAAGLAAVALMMIAAYYPRQPEAAPEADPGTTTIAAVMACFLLGALAVSGQPRLALVLAILSTALLHFKAELGGAARRLERRDLVSILQFAVVAFVVLPLLPDHGYGPYEALNPRHIWMMVVLISGLSLAGYVALRIAGGAHGALLLGAFGGMVSSTATTLASSRQAREGGAEALAGIVIVTANLVLLLRLGVLAAVVAPGVLPQLAPVLALALVAGALVFALRLDRDGARRDLAAPALGNPVELGTALGFALFYAAVLLVVAWLGDIAGSKGVYAVALASGLGDVDAITLSSLRLQGLGKLGAGQAVTAIVIAVAANAAVKLAIVRYAGSRALFGRCLPALGASVAAAAAGVFVFA